MFQRLRSSTRYHLSRTCLKRLKMKYRNVDRVVEDLVYSIPDFPVNTHASHAIACHENFRVEELSSDKSRSRPVSSFVETERLPRGTELKSIVCTAWYCLLSFWYRRRSIPAALHQLLVMLLLLLRRRASLPSESLCCSLASAHTISPERSATSCFCDHHLHAEPICIFRLLSLQSKLPLGLVIQAMALDIDQNDGGLEVVNFGAQVG